MYSKFPYQIDGRGRTSEADRLGYIRGLIEQVIFTAPGERVNRPTFGSGLHQLVFEPNNLELTATVQFLVQAALQQWLSEVIEVGTVDINVKDSSLHINITYRELRSPVVQDVTFIREF